MPEVLETLSAGLAQWFSKEHHLATFVKKYTFFNVLEYYLHLIFFDIRISVENSAFK